MLPSFANALLLYFLGIPAAKKHKVVQKYINWLL